MNPMPLRAATSPLSDTKQGGALASDVHRVAP